VTGCTLDANLGAGEDDRMKALVLIGVVLIVLGIIALAYQGFTYTTREKIVDLGPLKASVDREKTVPVPPILGGLAVAAGVFFVWIGARRS
jgi:uncharacterized membrane protein YidH (DUF202 family)